MTIVITKGGPGSGFTSEQGHKGRPGEVGGSSHSGSIDEFERTYYKSNKEWAMATDKDGNVVYATQGTSSEVSVPWDVAAKSRGGVFTHTHPVDLPLSIDDVAIAARFKYAEMRAVAADNNGRMVIYSIRPQEVGKWPNEMQMGWNVDGVARELHRKFGDLTEKDSDATWNNYWSAFWKAIAPRLGLVYTEERA